MILYAVIRKRGYDEEVVLVVEILKITKCLGDEIRLRILNILSYADLYVCEIAEILNLPQSTVSRHLLILKEASLVGYNKKGSWISYNLVKNDIYESFLKNIIEYNYSHYIKFKDDLIRAKNRLNGTRGCKLKDWEL